MAEAKLTEAARAVPAGFTLPWNTTRTMAEVWADDMAQKAMHSTRAGISITSRRPRITPQGKYAPAGYDKRERDL